ncbi:hypothetical protein CDL15_Pgr006350 [Punica granatum]|uniref:Uncharacterized protein n=1 Tax=Punica granatum TaxID=22663 RepID=A0A218W941_PUNGR|nr:hypothetical protein CDL15_Pgr006350 [Punica granatum]
MAPKRKAGEEGSKQHEFHGSLEMELQPSRGAGEHIPTIDQSLPPQYVPVRKEIRNGLRAVKPGGEEDPVANAESSATPDDDQIMSFPRGNVRRRIDEEEEVISGQKRPGNARHENAIRDGLEGGVGSSTGKRTGGHFKSISADGKSI